MHCLIDGYNLLNAAGVLPRGTGPGGLERSRLALLNFLVESLPPEELPRTTIVFDAREAPAGLPRVTEHRGLAVRFAPRDLDADAVIEELIKADSAPRRLTVVSSDHRIQRAARRRRARAVDSDVWYSEVLHARTQRRRSDPKAPVQPNTPLLKEDIHYWVRQFGGQSLVEQMLQEQQQATEAAPSPTEPNAGEKHSSAGHPPDTDKPLPGASPDLDNPFPPGYGEDLLNEE